VVTQKKKRGRGGSKNQFPWGEGLPGGGGGKKGRSMAKKRKVLGVRGEKKK